MILAEMHSCSLVILFLNYLTFICFFRSIFLQFSNVCDISVEKMNIAKIEHRAVIKFLTKEGNTPSQIRERMMCVFGSSCPSEFTIKFWSKQFKLGRESLEDDARSGRPVSAVTNENVAKVKKIILEDRRVKQWEIARDVGISKERVNEIIHVHLNMSKVSARWVPRMLTAFDKDRRVKCCEEFLEMSRGNEEEIVSKMVTCDETWIRQWDPESKQESLQWKFKDEKPPRKFKVRPSAGKLMATVFWDTEGILLIDYLPKKRTMNAEYYSSLLHQLRDAIKEKRRGKLSKGILILHDNAPVHTARTTMLTMKELGFDAVNHPPYSPDLAPCDYFLFRHLKKDLRGRRFLTDDEMKAAVSDFFDEKPKDFFFHGLMSIFDKCNKCISLAGDYIEK